MLALKKNNFTLFAQSVHRSTVQTNLYDLISAVADSVERDEEKMVGEVVQHIINSGKARFAGRKEIASTERFGEKRQACM